MLREDEFGAAAALAERLAPRQALEPGPLDHFLGRRALGRLAVVAIVVRERRLLARVAAVPQSRLRALGLVATDAELAALLGCDKALDPTELRARLKGLQATAAAADGAVLAQVQTCAVLRKAFQMQHNALQKALLDDETDQLLKITLDGAAAATSQASSGALGISSARAGAPMEVAASRAVVALAGACRSG